MKNKQTKATTILYFLLWITFIITIFSVISLLLEKRSQKEGFAHTWNHFTSQVNTAVNYVGDGVKEVVNDVGDAALRPILDSLRSVESGFNSINDGVNNLENEVLSLGERIDSIIRKNTSEITGGEITKGESLQRSTRSDNTFSKTNSITSNTFLKTNSITSNTSSKTNSNTSNTSSKISDMKGKTRMLFR